MMIIPQQAAQKHPACLGLQGEGLVAEAEVQVLSFDPADVDERIVECQEDQVVKGSVQKGG
jgi:hypothetical protein